MDLSFYAPKRRLESSALFSLKGVVSTDVYEILSQAIRLRTRLKHKENVKFFSDRTAVLFTDKRDNHISMAFTAAVTTLGGRPITLCASETPEDTARRVALAQDMGASAIFFDLEDLGGIIPLLPQTGEFFNANERTGPVPALATVLAVEKLYPSLIGTSAAVYEKETPSEVAIAFAKAQVPLNVFPCHGESAAAIEYLSQFTKVSVGAGAQKRSDVTVFDRDDPAALNAILGDGENVVVSVASPLIGTLEAKGKHRLSYDAATCVKEVIAAILSLIG